MRALLAALLFCSATLATVNDLPAHFYVKAVASDDTLNIRAESDASATILGDFGPYTINIEVLERSTDGKWGKVGLGETNGWVALRFLERSDHTRLNEIPRPISCFGTELIWTFNLTARGDEFISIDMPRIGLEPTEMLAISNGFFIEFSETERLMVRRGQCLDGLSDRIYRWQSTALYMGLNGQEIAEGSCTLDAAQ